MTASGGGAGSGNPTPTPTFSLTVASTPATIDDLNWQRQAEKARLSGLSTIQVAAERWGATLLAVTGLLATVTAVLGARDIGMLRDDTAKLVAGGLAAAAVLASGLAVVLAALAAQGKPTNIIATGPSLREISQTQAKTAAGQLRASRVISLAVLPLFLSAIAVITYFPRASSNLVLVTKTDGQSICAIELVGPSPGRILAKVSPNSTVSLPSTSVQQIKAVASCPQ